MASLEIAQVTKSFGTFEILRGINIKIRDGEFVTLVGPSGCGKSTLLRMIAGLESVTSGEIRIGDTVVNDVQPKQRDIAMVFQSYALYPHMTVAENMSFSMRLKKEPEAKIKASIDQAAEILGLKSLLDRYPKQLSGGQRQRVAMGRAIVRNPKVFLFDEPLSNLDAKLRVQMRSEIKELHQKLKTTTVYVTHDQIEAMTMADRIVVMRDGNIEQMGAPLEIYDRPANLFVAEFIGSPSMNLIRGSVRKGEFYDQSGNLWPIALPKSQAEPACEGRAIVLGIRPENLKIGPAGMEATLTLTEPTGSETQLIVSCGSNDLVLVSRERINLKPGHPLHLQVDNGNAHFFDAQSGMRLD